MTTTGTLAIGGIFLVICVGAVILVFDIASAWAQRREEDRAVEAAERAAAATFDADFIPTCDRVAPADRETDDLLYQVRAEAAMHEFERLVLIEEIDLMLDDAIDTVRGWRRGPA